MSRPTIMFSSTLGWNPGDEVIRIGIENLLAEKGHAYDRVIYDRNPSRNRNSRRRLGTGELTADYVVFAGSPEWCQEYPSLDDLLRGPREPRFWARALRLRSTDRRNDALLRFILERGVRCAMLGVGSSKKPVVTNKIRNILETHADALIVRDRQTFGAFARFDPVLAPCPALFAAREDVPRQSARRVGVTLQRPKTNMISIEKKAYASMFAAVTALHAARPDVAFLAHNRADFAFLKESFHRAEVRWARSGEAMVELYREFDVLFSTRLHGCILACSLGIPAYQCHHGHRMEALDLFPLAERNAGETLIDSLDKLDVAEHSRRALRFKAEAKQAWLDNLDQLSIFRVI